MVEKRHEDQLMARLDQLYLHGATYIFWEELYFWYDAQRLTPKIWRDLRSRWEELLEDKPVEKRKAFGDPFVSDMGSGISLVVIKEAESKRLSSFTA